MANKTVSAGHQGIAPYALTANQGDTVTFTDNVGDVQIFCANPTADVWISNDGTTPSVPAAGASTPYQCIPAGMGGVVTISLNGSTDVVGLVSAGTPTVGVMKK